MTPVNGGVTGGRARGPRARPHGSPVAVSRSGLGALGPPIPPRGLGGGLFGLLAARAPSPERQRRQRLAVMARPRLSGPAPGDATVHEVQ
jgi:hypothetical protein